MAGDIPPLTPLAPDPGVLRNRRVLVTGHTGFTGTWACHWLLELGAEVHGLSLAPDTDPSLFVAVGLAGRIAGHRIGDIRDPAVVETCFREARPELVLHLAAQPLVRRSYAEPVETFATNVMGTVHILEAARHSPTTAGIVCITTDKVYENRETGHAYRETDELGGKDPYSGSKAAAELAIHAYRGSLESWGSRLAIASARGGNIVGGGDWSADRLIPDFARAAQAGKPLSIRNPDATRPWQHVLCLVHGYLLLLAGMLARPEAVIDAWNFGPSAEDCLPVRDVIGMLRKAWGDIEVGYQPAREKEAQLLVVNSDKARGELGWRPAWDLAKTIEATAQWYRDYYANPGAARDLLLAQLRDYIGAIAAASQPAQERKR